MWHLKFLFFIVLSQQIVCENENDVDNFAVELLEDNFDNAIKENDHFVMFYAPWCGFSKDLFPLWENLAEMLNVKDSPRVVIAKVDCTSQQSLCAKYEIKGYPTLKFFKKDAERVTDFTGAKDLPTITNFISVQLGDVEPEESDEDNEIPDVEHKLYELTEDTFAKHVSSGKHFVKFYAPWCGHCQRLAPTWEELATSLDHDVAAKISKIDCTAYRPICQDFEVKGYPTLLWIEDGEKIDKYSGSRALDDLKAYVDKMSGRTPKADDKEEKPEEDASSVAQLSGNNFDTGIEKGVTFVKFYAPWCGHCQKLTPVWDQLATKMVGKPGVKIAKVDCTVADNKKLCAEEEIDSYPTLYIYKNGEKLVEYNGSRTLSDLYEFVNRHAGHDEL